MGMHHLVSRGLEIAHETMGHSDLRGIEMPSWGMAILAITAIIYMALHGSIGYTYGMMVPVLAMTEQPSTTTILRTAEYHDEDSADAPLLTKEEKEYMKPGIDEEVLIIAHKPLTFKFRTIIRHLKEKTGTRTSRFRGLGGWLVYTIATGCAMGLLRSAFGQGAHLLRIPVTGALCLLSTAWVQQVVAMPGKSYFERVGDLRRAGVFKKLFMPVVLVELIETVVFCLPSQLAILLSLVQNTIESERPPYAFIATAVVLSAITVLFAFFCVVIPLNIALVRLQASYLSEETETVIPIDRTLAGAERKDIRSAWKSFTREGCFRLSKTWIKVGAMQAVLAILFTFVVAGELRLILGDQIEQIAREHVQRMLK